jgi:hypothetical protein
MIYFASKELFMALGTHISASRFKQLYYSFVKSEVHTAVTMNIVILCDVMACSLVYCCFRRLNPS